MHWTKHFYGCNLQGCGVVNEYASPHQVPEVHIITEPGREVHLTFCSIEHQKEWLKQHGLEEE